MALRIRGAGMFSQFLSNPARSAVMNPQLRQFTGQPVQIPTAENGRATVIVTDLLMVGGAIYYYESFFEKTKERLMKKVQRDASELERKDLEEKKQTVRKIWNNNTREHLKEMRQKLLGAERVVVNDGKNEGNLLKA